MKAPARGDRHGRPCKGRKSVAHGASRGYRADNKERAPEGRKKRNSNFFRPSGASRRLVITFPTADAVGYIPLAPFRGYGRLRLNACAVHELVGRVVADFGAADFVGIEDAERRSVEGRRH